MGGTNNQTNGAGDSDLRHVRTELELVGRWHKEEFFALVTDRDYACQEPAVGGIGYFLSTKLVGSGIRLRRLPDQAGLTFEFSVDADHHYPHFRYSHSRSTHSRGRPSRGRE